MALLGGGGTPLGFSGLFAGQQFLNNQFDFDQRVRSRLAQEAEINFANQQLAAGFTSPQIQAQIGLNSPFLNQANSRLQSAIGIQRATAPTAIAQAQNGDARQLNDLLNLFGGNANVSPRNFNPVNFLALTGPQGLGQQLGVAQTQPLLNLQQRLIQAQLDDLLSRGDDGRGNGSSFDDFGFDQSRPLSFGRITNVG